MKKYCFDIAAFILSWIIGCEREVLDRDWFRAQWKMIRRYLRKLVLPPVENNPSS